MKKQEQMNTWVEEALASAEGIHRAEPRPFLLTRIQARMNKRNETVWDRVSGYLVRPAVVLTGICLILFINMMAVVFNGRTGTNTPTEQITQSANDEFSYTVATIYDIENTQP